MGGVLPSRAPFIDEFLAIQSRVLVTASMVRNRAFCIQGLPDFADQKSVDVSSLTGDFSRADKDLDDLTKRIRKVQKDVYLSKTERKRLFRDIKELRTSIKQYRNDIYASRDTRDLRSIIDQIQSQFNSPNVALPQLRKRVVRLLRDNPGMPLKMLDELCTLKARISGKVQSPCEHPLPEDPNLQHSDPAKQPLLESESKPQQIDRPPEESDLTAEQSTSSHFASDPTAVQENLSTQPTGTDLVANTVSGPSFDAQEFKSSLRDYQIILFLEAIDVIENNPAFISNPSEKNEALHSVANNLIDREFKLEIYRSLAQRAGKADKGAEQYGRSCFSKDLALLKEIVLQSRHREANLATGTALGSSSDIREFKDSSRNGQIITFLGAIYAIERDLALISDPIGRKEALHKAANNLIDREFKLEIYRSLAQRAGKADKGAEQYGRSHFSKDLGLLKAIVLQSRQQP